MAGLLEGRFRPPASKSTLRFLEHTRAEAEKQFCPGQGKLRGEPVEAAVSVVAQIPDRTPIPDAPIPVFYDTNEAIQHDAKFSFYPRDFAALAYVQLLAQHHSRTSTMTVVLGCDVVKDLNKQDVVAEIARNTLHRLTLGDWSTKEKAAEKERVATDAALHSFDLQEQARQCR